jgi:hypothetical protein
LIGPECPKRAGGVGTAADLGLVQPAALQALAFDRVPGGDAGGVELAEQARLADGVALDLLEHPDTLGVVRAAALPAAWALVMAMW